MEIKLLVSAFGFDLIGIYPAVKSDENDGYIANNGRFPKFFSNDECEVVE
jgi:hypothetical protein